VIVEFLITIFFFVLTTLLKIAGAVPPMPPSIQTIGNTIANYAVAGMSVVNNIVSETLVLAIFTMATFFMTYKLVWSVIVWAYDKIRG